MTSMTLMKRYIGAGLGSELLPRYSIHKLILIQTKHNPYTSIALHTHFIYNVQHRYHPRPPIRSVRPKPLGPRHSRREHRRLPMLPQPNSHRLTSILLFFVWWKSLDLCRSVLASHRQGHLARRQVRQREAQGADQLQGHRRFDLQGEDVSRPVSDFRHNDGLTNAEFLCCI